MRYLQERNGTVSRYTFVCFCLLFVCLSEDHANCCVERVLPKREKKHRTPESAHTENTEPRPRWWRCAEKNMGKELVEVLKALTDHLERKKEQIVFC